MKLLISNLKALAETVLANVLYTYDTEPARVISLAAAVVVFVAAKFGIAVPEQSALTALGLILPILFGGEAIRRKVTPTR